MQQHNPAIRKHFTVSDANATLPLVSAIVRDLTELAREVVQRRERLSDLPRGGGGSDGDDPYGAEVAQIVEDLDRDSQRLREYVEELLELGVKPRSVTEGIIDFPAMMDDRPVYLCWQLGEPEVVHWHEQGATFRDRRPLPDTPAEERKLGSDVGSAAP